MTISLKMGVFSDFLVIFGCKRVNCDDVDGDRPRLSANRNCYRLLCISWSLAQIFCFVYLFVSLTIYLSLCLLVLCFLLLMSCALLANTDSRCGQLSLILLS